MAMNMRSFVNVLASLAIIAFLLSAGWWLGQVCGAATRHKADAFQATQLAVEIKPGPAEPRQVASTALPGAPIAPPPVEAQAMPQQDEGKAARSSETAAVSPAAMPPLVVLELFSAETCPFCAEAERNFADLTANQSVIGITCMVDYFDSGQISQLARPFCAERQSAYLRGQKSGSFYTPQFVVNGAQQIKARSLEKISDALRRADAPQPIAVTPGAAPGEFNLDLPGLEAGDPRAHLTITGVLVQTVPDLASLDLDRARHDHAPRNLATAIVDGGQWDGAPHSVRLTVPPDAASDRLVVLAQDSETGEIVAAGQAALPKREASKIQP